MNSASQNPENSMVRKPKILYISLNPNLKGPLPKIDPLLIKALTNLGCQITKGTWGRHTEEEKMLQKLFGRLGDIGKVILTLARTHPDILYVATTLDERALSRDVPLLLATHLFPAKKILIEHGSKTTPLTLPGNNLYKFLTRSLIRLADAIFLLSTEEVKIWSGFEPKGRYFQVNNPFIPTLAVQSGNSINIIGKKIPPRNLLFAGRLIKSKGIFDLIDAMPAILSQCDCHLLVAGDGEERENIIRYIEKGGLKQHISILGYLDSDHLCDIYRSASILILPTYCGEGFPTVISEAMSFGLPIVTTHIRGTRDHLVDEVNALFVRRESPDEIANAVVRLLKDPELCRKMGCANIAKIQEFNPEILAPKYLQVFLILLTSTKTIANF